MEPRTREGVAEVVYVLGPTEDGGAVGLWASRSAAGAEEELCRVSRRGRDRERRELAASILNDLLAEPPAGKLVRDYARFLPLPEASPVMIPARDVAGWLQTWRPPLAAIFGLFRQPGRQPLSR